MPPVQDARTSFVEELMEAKKLQATELFGPWDTEDDGRIAVIHLRPLLLSVFPAPTATTNATSTPPCHDSAAADAAADTAAPSLRSMATGLLSLARVKKAYETVTRRPFSPSSPAAPAAARPHRPLAGTPVHVGPTLDEVHAIIDVLGGGGGVEGTAAASTRHPPARALAPPQKTRSRAQVEGRTAAAEEAARSAVAWGSAHRSGRDPITSPLSPPTPTIDIPAGVSRLPGASGAAVLDPRVPFLYGAMEAMYRDFCAATCADGEPVLATLPIDTAHLERLAVCVQSQPLRQGEARALQQLFASAQQGDVAATWSGPCLTLDAFVTILCSM